MGQPELFAKKTFADETARITGGAVIWRDPPEIRLESVRADGLLVVQRSEHLAGLAAPWPAAQRKDEVLVEVKMPGDHLDMKAVASAGENVLTPPVKSPSPRRRRRPGPR